MSKSLRLVLVGLGLCVGAAVAAHGQGLQNLRANLSAQETSTICGQVVRGPSVLPSPSSDPVIFLLAPCFGGPGRAARMSPDVFLQEVRLRPSQPSAGLWVPYDSAAERTIFEDFQRLWANHELAELSVDVRNYRFSNGVIGKLITYNITER